LFLPLQLLFLSVIPEGNLLLPLQLLLPLIFLPFIPSPNLRLLLRNKHKEDFTADGIFAVPRLGRASCDLRDPTPRGKVAMRKFANYPVIVNYNLQTRLGSDSQEVTLHEAKKYQQEKDLSIKVTKTSDATLKEFHWKKELEQFETDVYGQLQSIFGNPVGRKVLDLINKRTTVWIIPKSDIEYKNCTCAMTSPLNYDIPKDGSYAYGTGFGDTVILFDVRLGDDTLFHELVHAYRYSSKKFKDVTLNVDNDHELYQEKAEEFFAHTMENIYLSQGGRKLSKDYYDQEPANKDEIYDFLAFNLEMIDFMKFLLHHDTLASIAARSFQADYNPFRDWKEIEERYLRYKRMLGE
jgi:hypothetical protein